MVGWEGGSFFHRFVLAGIEEHEALKERKNAK